MKFLCVLLLLVPMGWTQAIPSVYFGMHDNKTNNWPPLSFSTFRLWDTGTQWGKIETSPGVYDFSRLDAFIAEATAAGVTDIVYNPSMTPTFYSSNPSDGSCSYGPGWCWAPTDVDSGNNHWKNFLIAVIHHVGPGKIKYYEGWNEPHVPLFWRDTTAHLKTMQQDLYNTVHANDPHAKVLMPPAGPGASIGRIQDMLANGIGSFGDVNTFHSKKCTPEDDVANTNTIKSAFSVAGFGGRELWNTEGGWGTDTSCPGAPHPDQVARLYLLNWSQGIARYIWYAYDNARWGQLGSGQSLNSAGIAFQQVYNWINGSTLASPCAIQSGTVWTCGFISASGNQNLIVWNTAGSSSYTAPSQYKTYQTLSGATNAANGIVTIGTAPLLFQSSSATANPQPPTQLRVVVH